MTQHTRDAPEQIVQDAFAAFRKRDVGTLALLAVPDSIQSFFEIQGPANGAESLMIEDAPGVSTTDFLRTAIDAVPQFVLEWATCTIIGHVVEPPDRAYVVFRLGIQSPSPPFIEPQIATLLWIDGRWRIMLDAMCPWILPGLRTVVFAAEP